MTWKIVLGNALGSPLIFLLWLALVKENSFAMTTLVIIGAFLLILFGVVLCLLSQKMGSIIAQTGFRDNAKENVELLRLALGIHNASKNTMPDVVIEPDKALLIDSQSLSNLDF